MTSDDHKVMNYDILATTWGSWCALSWYNEYFHAYINNTRILLNAKNAILLHTSIHYDNLTHDLCRYKNNLTRGFGRILRWLLFFIYLTVLQAANNIILFKSIIIPILCNLWAVMSVPQKVTEFWTSWESSASEGVCLI